MSFDVAATSYQRFMGRFSEPLADEFVRLADLERGRRALDVGCGPGALTSRLAAVVGAASVAAVDPSAPFIAAVRARLPEVDVRRASAENLPFPDGTFDAVLAQLVVHFMADPVEGLREMRRVAAPYAWVAACVWDHEGGTGPLSPFWSAVHDVDPHAPDESGLAGSREGHLAELFAQAGFTDPETSVLTVAVPFSTFEEWWEPFTLGVGPAGAYVAGRDPAGVAAVRERCRARLPDAPFTLRASAWAARGRAPS
ncbi:methyltransferase domain-containing protein [Mumia zhuanghuii]|uniref:Class I SAM-dependent methyltransferase n=2 Tax=Mumia TaxID=1546255 RepID=A0ABW1QKZ4_9ACTN|nr:MULTISPECIES: class I SAM-dependent methyltransferase [Mumia]KAA1419762.1 methyltransferase domain-containing protein [Mumia zhuanghuii]